MAIRVVIDSNCLNSEKLRVLLKSSVEHFAVITDYAWMEAYKSKSIPTIQKSLSIIGNHPNQTIILKGTKFISGLDYRTAGVAAQMEWKGVRAEFHESLEKIRSLDGGRDGQIFEKNAHVLAAINHIEGRLLDDIQQFAAAFGELSNIFLTDEISSIRIGKPVSKSIARKIFLLADDASKILAKRHPSKIKGMNRPSWVNNFCLDMRWRMS